MRREVLGADVRLADAVFKNHIPSLRILLKYAERQKRKKQKSDNRSRNGAPVLVR